MNKIILLLLAGILNVGCVLNMSMAHTEGTASDVIDDTNSNDTEVSPDVNVPVGGPVPRLI